MELPDGVVHTRDFLEHDGHENVLHVIDCVLTKRGDSLAFDFSGSSPQAHGFVNCSRAGLVGGVAGAVIPTLGFGIPWNEGMLRPVSIKAPDGLVCTAVPPAPVGSATVEAVWTVSNVVSAALNRLLLASPAYAHRAQAVGLTVSVPQAEALVMTHGAEVPNSAGLGGGLPGGLVHQRFTASGRPVAELGPKPGSFPITPDDLFEVTWQGGGGLGDPLDRDPADVLADVRYGVVSVESARETYGVVLAESGEAVDAAATTAARRAVRAARLGVYLDAVADPAPVRDALPAGTIRLADRIVASYDEAAGWEVRTLDGAALARGSTRWREGAHRFALTLPAASGRSLHAELTVTGWACPLTGALLGVDVHLRGQGPFHDLDLGPLVPLRTSPPTPPRTSTSKEGLS